MRYVLMRALIIALSLSALAAAPAFAAESGTTEPKPAEKTETKPAEKTETKPGDAMIGRVTLEQALAEKVLGKKEAPITILAFESLTCPHCAAFHRETLPELKKQYIETGKAKLVFMDFPLDNRAMIASMLARCVGEERFFAVVELLFSSQRRWALVPDGNEFIKELGRIGRFGGLTEEQFQSCMRSEPLFNALKDRRTKFGDQYEISSTPTFVINGQKIVGAQPFAEFEKILKPLVK